MSCLSHHHFFFWIHMGCWAASFLDSAAAVINDLPISRDLQGMVRWQQCSPRPTWLSGCAQDPELPPGAIFTQALAASSPGLRGQEGCIWRRVRSSRRCLALQDLQELQRGHQMAAWCPHRHITKLNSPPSWPCALPEYVLTLKATPLGEMSLKPVLVS